MKGEVLVSVLMPAYNAAQFVGEAISSVLEQSYENFELIIINDGSNDSTESEIALFDDERIHYYKNEQNIGLIATLNNGIELCKGKYIVRMDADDVCLHKRIEKQVQFMEQHSEVAVAGSWYYAFTLADGIEVKGGEDPDVLKSTLIFNTPLCHPATIIRKSILNSYNFRYDPKYRHVEDYELWMRISKVAKISNVQEFLFRYRSHDMQVSMQHNGYQKDVADVLRGRYLAEMGFVFSDEELATHNLVAANIPITSKEQLDKIDQWFKKLLQQNGDKRNFEPHAFKKVIGKFWADSCGFTNLGLYAYSRFFRSELKEYHRLGISGRMKLLVKCFIRRKK
ncbi:MAG: glycosyltransferase family 2 protein [Bacteroidia bacterium]